LILATVQPRGLPVHYVVAMITSQLTSPPFPADTAIRAYAAAGLPKPSLARLAKVVTIDATLVRRKFGRLESADRKNVALRFKRLFEPLLE